MRKSCSMCLMPFSKDTGNRESENHCSYCFKNGEILFKGIDVHEFKNMCYQQMVKSGMPKLLARFYAFMILFAPHWKNLKKENLK